jgi:chromosome partitioning protein
MIIAVANQKGGVGKTTTVLNLGAALAETGREVLLVDLDPQANLTAGLGRSGLSPTVHDLLTDATAAESPGMMAAEGAVHPTDYEGLSLMPSELDLAAMELLLARQPQPQCLFSVLAALERRFDFILIDCPPYLGQLTVAALHAAPSVLVPMLPSVWALAGLGMLHEAIETVGSRLLGVVLTQYDRRTAVSDDVYNSLHRIGLPLCRTRIPKRVAAEYAAIAGVPVLVHQPDSALSMAYRRLAQEVEELVEAPEA